MPGLIADALACVGESMTDWLDLVPVRPLYRARFADGSSLDVHADPDAMAEEIAAVCGPADAAGYRRYVAFVSRLYELEMHGFIDRNIDSPFGLLTPDLARLAAIGGFRRLAPKVAQFFGDDRTRRVFSFQSMYAGLSPYDALAIYAVIGYMDSVAGVFFPKGGMHAIPRALAAAAQKHGAEFCYGTTVERVELRGSRAVAVHTTAGERVPCDAVVLNPDLPRRAPGPAAAPAPSAAALLAVLLRPARRLARRLPRRRAPHDLLRRRVEGRLRRRARRPADVGPVVPGDLAQPDRPLARAPGPVELLRAVPDPEPRRPHRLGRGRAALPGPGHRDPGGAWVAGLPRGHRGRARDDAAGLGPAGHGSRYAVRGGAHVRPDRPLPAAQPLGRERRLRRFRDAARRRRSHGAHLRPAGRGAHHGRRHRAN